MRSRSRRGILIGSLLACIAGGAVGAQDKPVDSLETLRERARADKKAVVASVVELTESEARVFWPVYNAYQSDMVGHYDRVLAFIDTYAKAYGTMTDAERYLCVYLRPGGADGGGRDPGLEDQPDRAMIGRPRTRS
jgi:hypothetical protein